VKNKRFICLIAQFIIESKNSKPHQVLTSRLWQQVVRRGVSSHLPSWIGLSLAKQIACELGMRLPLSKTVKKLINPVLRFHLYAEKA
jgi:hypothetical protein